MKPNEKQMAKILENAKVEAEQKLKEMLEAEQVCFNQNKDGSDFALLPPNPMFVRTSNMMKANAVNELFKALDEKDESKPENRESDIIRGYMA